MQSLQLSSLQNPGCGDPAFKQKSSAGCKVINILTFDYELGQLKVELAKLNNVGDSLNSKLHIDVSISLTNTEK